MRSVSDSANKRKGAMLPLIAVVVVALMALMALAVDGGLVQRQRRLAQNAADAGALAGAQEIFRNQSHDTVVASAAHETTRNGFSDGVNRVKVVIDTLNTGALFGGGTYIRVTVYDTVATTFAGSILRKPTVMVRAEAIGGIIPPSGDCIVSLDRTDNQALRIDGGANVQAPNCGIRVNSSATGGGTNDAMYVSGATLNAAGGTINVTGGEYGTTVPAATTGVTPTADPLGYLTMPSFSHTCTFTNFNLSSGTQTLTPGTYCGGITIQGNTSVGRLNSGDYYLLGGGLNVKSGGTIISTGAGTTFINTWDATHPYSRVNLQSGSTDTLYANTGAGAALPGILIYQDPSVTGSAGLLAGDANQIQSGTGSVFTGSIYFPTQDVEIHSGSNLTMNGGIVARQVWVHNNTTVTFTGGSAGTDFFKLKRASLVQ